MFKVILKIEFSEATFSFESIEEAAKFGAMVLLHRDKEIEVKFEYEEVKSDETV